MEVWLDHEVIATHPSGSREEPQPDGSLVVRERDGTEHRYEAGTWHAAGRGFVCAFLEPRDDCPRCQRRD